MSGHLGAAGAGVVTQPGDTGALPEPPISTGRSWEHQKKMYWFAADLWFRGKRGVGIYGEMGVGKTLVAAQLRENFRARKTLVICPKSVMSVWPEELDRHSVHLPQVFVPEGTKKKRAEQISYFLQSWKDEDVAVILNYDVCWQEPIRSVLLKELWHLVILDEAHRIKGAGSRVSRFCATLGKQVRRKLALTGTPLAHSPLDAYGLYRFLDPSVFGWSYARFRNRYAVMSHTTPPFPVDYKNLEELQEKMYRIAIRLKKEDALSLPEVTHVERSCHLGRKAMLAYQELADELYTEIEGGEITAANALVRLLRLRQITGGVVKDDDGRERSIDTAKEELLSDVLEGLPSTEPVVVFTVFHFELEAVKRIAKKQGRRYAELSGRTNELKPWQDGDADIIGVQIQAGGVGISLVRAAYAVYYSVGFNLAEFEQSLARLHRPGQSRPVTFYHLLAEGTVDGYVYEALRKRKNVVESVLNRFQELV